MNVGDQVRTLLQMFSLPEGTVYERDGVKYVREVFGWTYRHRLYIDAEVPLGGTITKVGQARRTTAEQYIHMIGQMLVGQSIAHSVSDMPAREAMAKFGLNRTALLTAQPGSIVHPRLRANTTIPDNVYLQQGGGDHASFAVVARGETLGEPVDLLPMHVIPSGESKALQTEGEEWHLDIIREALKAGAAAKIENSWCPSYEHVMDLLRMNEVLTRIEPWDRGVLVEPGDVWAFMSRDFAHLSVHFRNLENTLIHWHHSDPQGGVNSYRVKLPRTRFGVIMPDLLANSLPGQSRARMLWHSEHEFVRDDNRATWRTDVGHTVNGFTNKAVVSSIGHDRIQPPSGERIEFEGSVIMHNRSIYQRRGEEWINVGSGKGATIHTVNDEVTFLGEDITSAIVLANDPLPANVPFDGTSMHGSMFRDPFGYYSNGQRSMGGTHLMLLKERPSMSETIGTLNPLMVPPGTLVSDETGRQWVRTMAAYFVPTDRTDRDYCERLNNARINRWGAPICMAPGETITADIDTQWLPMDTVIVKDDVYYRMCHNGWQPNGQGTSAAPLNSTDWTGATISVMPRVRAPFMALPGYPLERPMVQVQDYRRQAVVGEVDSSRYGSTIVWEQP